MTVVKKVSYLNRKVIPFLFFREHFESLEQTFEFDKVSMKVLSIYDTDEAPERCFQFNAKVKLGVKDSSRDLLYKLSRARLSLLGAAFALPKDLQTHYPASYSPNFFPKQDACIYIR